MPDDQRDDEREPAPDASSDEPETDEKSKAPATSKAGATSAGAKGSTAEDDDATAARPDRRGLLVRVAAVLVAVGLFGWALQGYLGAVSDRDGLADDVRVRDEVQVEANQAIEVLNTLDARDIDAGLDAWASVSTGDLQEELTDLSPSQREALSGVARISEGTVISSAVTRLDAAGGSASVIAFVEKQVGDTPREVSESAPSRIQFTADLRQEDGEWLVTTLTPVAVVTPEGQEAP